MGKENLNVTIYNKVKLVNNVDEFKEKFSSEYKKAIKNGSIDTFFPDGISFTTYWNIEKLKNLFKGYKSKSSFKSENILLSYFIARNGWDDDVYGEIGARILVGEEYIHVSNITKDQIINDLIPNYTKWSDFHKKHNSVIKRIKEEGWLVEMQTLLPYQKHKPDNYWSYEKCKDEALKYNSDIQFKKYAFSCRVTAKLKGYYDDISQHFKVYKDEIGVRYWDNKQLCKREASKYNDSADFRKTSPGAYLYSKNRGWINEFFPNYKSPRSKPSGYWDDIENCKKEALKYDSRTMLMRKNQTVYVKCIKNGWIDDVCSHMKPKIRFRSHWNNFNICKKEALKYKTKSEFKYRNKNAYEISVENGWLADICTHMLRNHRDSKPTGYWNSFVNCKNEALNYTTKTDFKIGCEGAYHSSLKNNWLDEVSKHMNTQKKKPSGYWDIFENCEKEALKYQTRNNFMINSATCHYHSRKNGWMDKICLHMVTENKKPAGYWNFHFKCKKEAQKYNNRKAFDRGSNGAYKASRRNGWLDDVCSHMK